jgi:hypothetical protein
MVQRMAYGATPNNGWCIQVNNEAANANTGCYFYTSDYSVVGSRPKLIVKYYSPLSLANVDIIHESGSGLNDGEIDITHTGGASTNFTYDWINSAGTSIGSTADITGLPYGWYGLHIRGVEYGEEFYMAFLVGLACREVTIDFEATSGNSFENYVDNAFNSDLTNGGITWGNYNSGNNTNFQTSRYTVSGNISKANSFMRFRLWMADDMMVNQADLTMQGKSHTGTNNAGEMLLSTGDWNENLITWNLSPTVSSSTSASLPQTSSTNQDITIDMIDFWNQWKANNASNYGVVFQLLSYATATNAHVYHSPTASAYTDKPDVSFKVAVWEGDECVHKHANLDYKMDGSYYVVKEGMLRFMFNQEYDAEDLTFNMYNYKDELVLSDNDIWAIPTTNGKNYLTIDLTTPTSCLDGKGFFYIEVINSKKEKLYLRFYNDYDDCQSGATQ